MEILDRLPNGNVQVEMTAAEWELLNTTMPPLPDDGMLTDALIYLWQRGLISAMMAQAVRGFCDEFVTVGTFRLILADPARNWGEMGQETLGRLRYLFGVVNAHAETAVQASTR